MLIWYLLYLLLCLVCIPLLPLLYWQGKRIKRDVPELAPATGPKGSVGEGEEELRILILGESTMAGIGVTEHQYGFAGHFAGYIAQGLEKTVHWEVIARSGYTAKQVHQLLLPQIKKEAYDLIVIGLGGNDAFAMNPPWFWRKQIRVLLEKLRIQHIDTPIAFANMPPIHAFPAFTPLLQWILGNQVQLLGKVLAKFVNQQKTMIFNAEKATLAVWKERYQIEGDASIFFSDGVHPSELTYEIWGKDFAHFLIEQSDFF